MPIRASIGAGRGGLVRQLLTESVTIALMGAAVGCGVAAVLLGLLSNWRAALEFPGQFDANPDWRVFLFACSAAVVTGLLCGIGPANRVWKTDVNASMR